MNTEAPDLLAATSAYYSAKLAEHGPVSRGVDWRDAASHERRHRQFLRLIEDRPDASVLDLGCGYGDFLRYIRERGHTGRFTGLDVSPSMIEAARNLYPDETWIVGSTPTPTDFAVASGIFNVKRGAPDYEWSRYMADTIDALNKVSRIGFGFNALSLSSDPDKRRHDLFYADPVQTLSDCLSRFGRSVALLQDYGLWEFTILVRKDWPA